VLSSRRDDLFDGCGVLNVERRLYLLTTTAATDALVIDRSVYDSKSAGYKAAVGDDRSAGGVHLL